MLGEVNAQQAQLACGPRGGLTLPERREQIFQATDFLVHLELRRHEAGILEDTVGHTELLRNERVVVEREGFPATRKVVELAAFHGLGDTLLGDEIE